MKHILFILTLACMILTSCNETPENNDVPAGTASSGTAEGAAVIMPLPDTTMENIENTTAAVSLTEEGVYMDGGALMFDVTVYTYDIYDAVDIAAMDAGSVIMVANEEITVESVSTTDAGYVLVNGGLMEGGFELAAGDGGTYSVVGFNDAKEWYEAGKVSLKVHPEFTLTDSSDFEAGEVTFYAGDFLVDAVTDYNFNPANTTLRIEDGLAVAMTRIFMP